ncbi:MAG: alginate export family protein [Nitrosopumilaceae archaeon]|nr:alginate export family protein [Nitrosopumilaceae archaeon]
MDIPDYLRKIIFIFLILISNNYTFGIGQSNVINKIDHTQDGTSNSYTIHLSGKAHYKVGEVPENQKEPYRVYIDFKDTKLDKQIPYKLDTSDSLVKRIRSAQFNTNTARVVFDLSEKHDPIITAHSSPSRLQISFENDKDNNVNPKKHAANDDKNNSAVNDKSSDISQTELEKNTYNTNSNGDNGDEPLDPDARPPLPIKIGDKISIGGKVNLKLDTSNNNEDLDNESDDTLTRLESQLSIAGLINPLPNIDIYGEGRFTNLQLFEDEFNTDDEDNDPELRRAYIHWRDFAFEHFDFQVGRQRFKDDREWIYDDNLDGFRIFYKPGKFSTELSVSSILVDLQDSRDKTVNYIIYSQYEYDKKESISVFSVIRQDRDGIDDTYTFGASWRARPLSHRNRLWVDNAVFIGRNRDDRWVQGYGIDAGLTKSFKLPLRPNITIASAFGSKNFRQNGLEDNSGRFKGSTKFKYYGEVFDPELANMFIETLGVGIKPHKRRSLDLVYHYYYQVDKEDRLISTDIEPDPTGENQDIGHELNVIMGTKITKYAKVALIGGLFFPGSAFEEDDLSYFGEIELQFAIK